jgi:hypothetical protein
MFTDATTIKWMEDFDPLDDLLKRSWPFAKTRKAVEGLFLGMEGE